MTTPKEMGKAAKKNGINAPTLDDNLSSWLAQADEEKRIDHYVRWWEGWYEALDESLAFRNESFTRNSHTRSVINSKQL